MFAAEGTGPAWAMKIEEVRAGYARVSMPLRDDMLNGHRTAHGGVVFALADTAFAYVCNGANDRSVAAYCTITFLNPAREGDVLVAEAEEIVREGRTGMTRCSISTADGRRIAEFTGTSRTVGGHIVDA
jgi:acyl-CoA thioesterase